MTEQSMRKIGSDPTKCIHGVSLDQPCMGCQAMIEREQVKGVESPNPATPTERPIVAVAAGSPDGVIKTTMPVPDIQPLIPDLAKHTAEAAPVRSAEEVRAAIESAALEAAEVAVSSVKVDLQFPAIGFIDPGEELQKMRRLVEAMPESMRPSYPETIRAKLLASHANPQAPEVTDEELALAIYIRRTSDSALTTEDLEAKATGKKSKATGDAAAPKKGKTPKAAQRGLDDILGL
jgi:hypothetical protein